MFGRRKEKAPEWASVLKDKNYTLFMEAVDDYFRQKGDPYTIDDGVVRLTESDGNYGLYNIVQICAQVSQNDYSSVIRQHFDHIFENEAFRANLNLNDFTVARQYLGVRLYPKEYVDTIGAEKIAHRPFVGELLEVLVYDMPDVVETVPSDQTEKWGVALDELFAMGAEYVKSNYQFHAERVALQDDDALYAVETDHFFAANILLEMESHPEFIGRGGAIIGAPLRNLVLIYPINDLKVVNSLKTIIDNVSRFYFNGPGSLTEEIYWYRNRQFEKLNYTSGEQASFTPSEAFMALLSEELS